MRQTMISSLGGPQEAHSQEPRRALVLHDRQLVVDLITLTLNHGLFVVRAARNLAEAEAILATWQPHMTVIDMDHDDSEALLQQLGAPNRLRQSVLPVLGLTRRGDLQTKLQAFDLGVDDILTVPFSPEELLARSIVITRRATGTDVPIVPTIKLGEIEIDILHRVVHAGDSVMHLSGIEQSLLYLLASRGGQRRDAGTTSSTPSGAPTSWPRATSSIATSGACASSYREDHRHPRFIATVPGKGYRFIPTFTNKGWEGGANQDDRRPATRASPGGTSDR